MFLYAIIRKRFINFDAIIYAIFVHLEVTYGFWQFKVGMKERELFRLFVADTRVFGGAFFDVLLLLSPWFWKTAISYFVTDWLTSGVTK